MAAIPEYERLEKNLPNSGLDWIEKVGLFTTSMTIELRLISTRLASPHQIGCQAH